MLFERIESSEGLAHYSYIMGDQGEAVVIDPQRDCDIYIEKTLRAGYRLTHVLETHRNEDYVVGSPELAARAGATAWHADRQFEYKYGQAVSDGQTWQVGRLSIRAMHTPGHTPGHMSYILNGVEGEPWMVFTGDALFAGDVGRVDLMGEDALDEMARLLYDSLFERLLPLGDEIIVCPAHGAGSACGSSIIAERPWTTLGLERWLNPRLQVVSENDFVREAAALLERPPYFRKMEQLNLAGAPPLCGVAEPVPLSPSQFAEQSRHAVILDTRSAIAFGAAHIPKSLSIWQGGLAAYGGWFLPYDRPILLVNEGEAPANVVVMLARMGYDNVGGYLAGGIQAWHDEGLPSGSHGLVTVQELCSRLDASEGVWVLDVRSDAELQTDGRIPDAYHVHVTQLPENLDQVPSNRPLYIFCGTDLRSTIAASFLKQHGWRDVTVVLGGLQAWSSISCPIEL